MNRDEKRASGTHPFLRLIRMQEIGVLFALLLLCTYLTVSTSVPGKGSTFLTPLNLLQVARQASYYGIMAVGMVFVIAMGEIDLSVGSILTLTNVAAALALKNGLPLPAALLIGLGAGAGCGLINGCLSVGLQIPTFIVTLGTLSLFRGFALVLCSATPISQFSKDNPFFIVGGGTLGTIPTSVVFMLLAGAAGWVMLTRSTYGRHLLAIGSSPVTARLSGIPLNRYRIAVMTLNGMISALAGILALAFLQSADPSTGPGYELWVIASVIIGGTALSGGRGSVPGAILGALIIAVIRNGIILLGFSTYSSTMVTGAVIILAVAIDAFVKRRMQPKS